MCAAVDIFVGTVDEAAQCAQLLVAQGTSARIHVGLTSLPIPSSADVEPAQEPRKAAECASIVTLQQSRWACPGEQTVGSSELVDATRDGQEAERSKAEAEASSHGWSWGQCDRGRLRRSAVDGAPGGHSGGVDGVAEQFWQRSSGGGPSRAWPWGYPPGLADTASSREPDECADVVAAGAGGQRGSWPAQSGTGSRRCSRAGGADSRGQGTAPARRSKHRGRPPPAERRRQRACTTSGRSGSTSCDGCGGGSASPASRDEEIDGRLCGVGPFRAGGPTGSTCCDGGGSDLRPALEVNVLVATAVEAETRGGRSGSSGCDGSGEGVRCGPATPQATAVPGRCVCDGECRGCQATGTPADEVEVENAKSCSFGTRASSTATAGRATAALATGLERTELVVRGTFLDVRHAATRVETKSEPASRAVSPSRPVYRCIWPPLQSMNSSEPAQFVLTPTADLETASLDTEVDFFGDGTPAILNVVKSIAASDDGIDGACRRSLRAWPSDSTTTAGASGDVATSNLEGDELQQSQHCEGDDEDLLLDFLQAYVLRDRGGGAGGGFSMHLAAWADETFEFVSTDDRAAYLRVARAQAMKFMRALAELRPDAEPASCALGCRAGD